MVGRMILPAPQIDTALPIEKKDAIPMSKWAKRFSSVALQPGHLSV
jgi:hypothetical protein